MSTTELWDRHRRHLCSITDLDLTLDPSRMRFDDGFLERMAPALAGAFDAMEELERGAIANPDEGRMVGHYWLREPHLAPAPEITAAIRDSLDAVRTFAAAVHSGSVRPPGAPRFTRVISIGIGGSALGPMFVCDALGDPAADRIRVDFIDNTDPDGIGRVLRLPGDGLDRTLCLVISKSGGTAEPRNAMRLAAEAYDGAGLEFGRHAVAVTIPGSELDRTASSAGWIARFPMFDWVGGRTSVLSAAGLLPAALQGLDISDLLAGAAVCDEATRLRDLRRNPAAMLALMWHHAGGGRGRKAMVVLPYRDRLLLLGRYLQQLVMESIGKRLDLKGERVDQGLTVYGNKGSTDQHAYVQQLRDGPDNFFVVFVRALESGGSKLEVEEGVRAGDYLHGFLLGTREALFDNERESLMITIPRVDAVTVGALIALFERAVGLYAGLLGINAYHQPGVEAGKQAASSVLDLQRRVIAALTGAAQTADQIAAAVRAPESAETVYLLLEHLAANGRARVFADEVDPGRSTFIVA